MIIVKLSEILGRKKLKIADVIRDTGITRPTLTSLYYGNGTGINFDTLNKLCRYLKINTEDLIKFYDVDITSVDVQFSQAAEGNDDFNPSYLCYKAVVNFAQNGYEPINVIAKVVPCDFRLIDINVDLLVSEDKFTTLFPLDVRDVIFHEIGSAVYCRFISSNDEKTEINNVAITYNGK